MQPTLLALIVGALLVLATGDEPRPVAGHLRVAIDSAAGGADFSRTAERQRLVILQEWEQDRLRALKAADPSVRVLLYRNLSAMMAPDAAGNASTGLTPADAEPHPGWFLLDPNGARLASTAYPWLWLADVGDRSYQRAWTEAVLTKVRAQGWDGVFADDVNPTVRHHVDPALVARYPSDAAYAAATESALAAIGPAIRDEGMLFVANFGAWSAHRRVVDGWLDHVSGGMEEHFAKWGSAPDVGYATGAAWERQVGAVEAAESRGKLFLGVTHSANGDVAAARYGWASLLLAAGGNSVFALHGDYTNETWFPEYDIDLGAPAGSRVREASGVHRRAFADGLVLVNPTAAAVPVEFGGVYSGSGLSQSRGTVMAPHSGLVLRAVSPGA